MQIYLLQALVFLASFLIFQIELILGKLILPGFGGGYLVWGISVVFYQGLLLLGYLHLHILNRFFRSTQWMKWHGLLLLGSLFWLPLQVDRLQNPTYQFSPVVEIVLLLAVTVGFLFFILAGLSIYTQLLLVSSTLPEKKNPYILYAGSNLGAFAALLAYPVFFEPNFDISTQLVQWEIGYGVLALFFVVTHWAVPRGEDKGLEKIIWPKSGQTLRWLLLSAAPAAMFLATTNIITFDIAPVPFLWIPPLALYLLTLVLSFKSRPFCPGWVQDRFYLVVYIGVFLFLFKLTGNSLFEYLVSVLLRFKLPYYFTAVVVEPLLQLGICFIFCLVCHYKLSQSKPADTGQLTAFYLTLALGGFLGGVLVNWIVPLVFNVMIEPLIAFFIAACAFALLQKEKPVADKKFIGLMAGIVILVILWPNATYYFKEALGPSVSIAIGIFILILLYLLKGKHYQVSWVLLCLIVLAPFLNYLNQNKTILFQGRNYYGIYKVHDEAGFRRLSHGTTLHGAQSLEESKKNLALAYYHKESPMGEFLQKNPFNYSHISLIGLGAGSLAVYARPSDRYDFFELDPLVGKLAWKYFTFLSESRGKIRIVYGDARLSLRKEEPGKYDAIIVDVFNSGSIPVHMVTVEAVKEYRRALTPDGILFFHVSNQFLDLVPVLYAIAGEVGLHACIKTVDEKNPPERETSIWLALTADQSVYSFLQSSMGWRNVKHKTVKPWTDRYSSIISTLF